MTVEDNDMSGIEMESPHKEMVTAVEFPCNIPEVGDICTSWIGQRGVGQILKMREHEIAEREMHTKCHELQVLAVECLQAFEAVGVCDSSNPQLCKAVDLCLSYAPRFRTKLRKTSQRSTACEIANLWKQPNDDEASGQNPSVQSLAETILGDKLVDKVTEKNRQPPDVSVRHVAYVQSFCTLQCV